MKNKSDGFLKQVIAGLNSKTLALKSKTNAMKARLIIFSLLMDKRYVMSSISDKFQSLLGHHSQHNDQSLMLVGDASEQCYEAVSNPSETQLVVEDKDQGGGCESYCMYGENEDGGDDLTLTHSLHDSEYLDLGDSVIDLVKNSEDEAGQEFKAENEIDLMADLFIKKFRKQILLQELHSTL